MMLAGLTTLKVTTTKNDLILSGYGTIGGIDFDTSMRIKQTRPKHVGIHIKNSLKSANKTHKG